MARGDGSRELTLQLPVVEGDASLYRLARLADGLHNPMVAENRVALREQLLRIQAEAQQLIEQLDARAK